MEEQNMDILERIHASYYQLTATERRVADFVLAQHTQVQFMSITQLADECGTAEATISRFCRSLKLKGFNAFKIELARHSAGNVQKNSEQPSDTLVGRSLQVGRLANDAVYQTIELVEPKEVLKAVEMFEDASRVLCFGAGGSMLMAQELAHLFSTVTGKFTAISDSHMQMSAAATMSRSDVLVLFSYSGATTGGLQLLELAKARGIRTILVTRFHKSPAANLADVVLRCGSNEGPFQFGSTPAKIAQLIVMDVLYQEYCHRNRDICEDNIQSIASALSGMHV
ncbi:MAG: MurR/RpiR family transcriptional regulator [Oscillospiraceae bacterium]|nr:MurR/RpiR family transcriptional regulator [Oscillospiraceae bacterium]MBQ7129428.1 MurR/RpiR family transcriptional regulator [Oscillospiraceae bacterium]